MAYSKDAVQPSYLLKQKENAVRLLWTVFLQKSMQCLHVDIYLKLGSNFLRRQEEFFH